MPDIVEREQKTQLEKRVEGPGNDTIWTWLWVQYGFSPSCGFEMVWEAFLFLEDRGDSTGFVSKEGAARPGRQKTEEKVSHGYKAKLCPPSTKLH